MKRWQNKAIDDAYSWIKNRERLGKETSLHSLEVKIWNRAHNKTGQIYIDLPRLRSKTKAYKHKYDCALGFLKFIIKDNPVTAYDAIVLSKIVSEYYGLHGNSLNCFNEQTIYRIYYQDDVKQNDILILDRGFCWQSLRHMAKYALRAPFKKCHLVPLDFNW